MTANHRAAPRPAPSTAATALTREAQTGYGQVYTPPALVQPLVAESLAAVDPAVRKRVRILDPACGDGAFLLACAAALAAQLPPRDEERGAQHRLRVVQQHLFGVDLDPAAIAALRRRLHAWIDPEADPEVTPVALEQNFQMGDALCGPAFGETDGDPRYSLEEAPRRGLDWNAAFLQVGEAGGFDLVIGNPPYVRERNARRLFTRLSVTPLGQRWREARMDLWYYFVHRGLDLLRPGGRLAFVVSSYWTAARGARRLIDRLRDETTFEAVRLLGNEPVFPGVSGRHLTFRLKREPAQGSSPQARICDETTGDTWSVAHPELFESGRIVWQPRGVARGEEANSSPADSAEIGHRRGRAVILLGAQFQTRQGIAENPPVVPAAAAREFPHRFTTGESVFLWKPEEVNRSTWLPHELGLFRPYYATAVLERYVLPPQPSHYLLYLTRHTAPDIALLPNIAQHLERFRILLERRREVALGKIAWWHLHWPREESLFLQPRILAAQMGSAPRFAFVEKPTFVGFSMNLIRPATPRGLPLPVLTGLLNSRTAADWFQRHAKRRGAQVDITGEVLRQFPLPPRDAGRESVLAELVAARMQAGGECSGNESARAEAAIHNAVAEWYRSV